MQCTTTDKDYLAGLAASVIDRVENGKVRDGRITLTAPEHVVAACYREMVSICPDMIRGTPDAFLLNFQGTHVIVVAVQETFNLN